MNKINVKLNTYFVMYIKERNLPLICPVNCRFIGLGVLLGRCYQVDMVQRLIHYTWMHFIVDFERNIHYYHTWFIGDAAKEYSMECHTPRNYRFHIVSHVP